MFEMFAFLAQFGDGGDEIEDSDFVSRTQEGCYYNLVVSVARDGRITEHDPEDEITIKLAGMPKKKRWAAALQMAKEIVVADCETVIRDLDPTWPAVSLKEEADLAYCLRQAIGRTVNTARPAALAAAAVALERVTNVYEGHEPFTASDTDALSPTHAAMLFAGRQCEIGDKDTAIVFATVHV